MEALSLKEVAEASRGVLSPEDAGDLEVNFISTDTRTLPDGSLFVPLRGENFNGHDFVRQAIGRGARAYLTDNGTLEGEGRTTPHIRVRSTLDAYMEVARYYRSKHDPVVVGITGSNGKTTTKDLLGHVLSDVGPTVFSEKSFNNFVGLPATILRIEEETRFAVLEMGTNQPGEIGHLARVAAPHIGIITNVSQSHLEGLKSLEGVAREKAAMLGELTEPAVAVLNRDDPSYEMLAEAAPGKVVTFGICHRSDYTAINIEVELEGVRFEVAGTKVRLPLLGVHSIYNALAVFACVSELDVHPERTAKAFESFESPPMRLKPIRKGELLVLNDTYNANPGSMESAIKTFSVLPVEGRKVVVLGDMLELGEQTTMLHEKVGEQLSCGDFDLVVGVGVRAPDYLAGAKKRGIPVRNMISFSNTDEALESLPGMINPKDSILVKGSRRMGLEKIVDAVLAAEL
jgi:UDP-N-acetylmuramoyl-tripeptide--D-alanyl-D-alanine ligase